MVNSLVCKLETCLTGGGEEVTCEQQPDKPVSVSVPVSLSQVFTRYGKCYMFNAAEEGKTLRTTMKGGTGNGLEIMLDIQQDEYLPVWGDSGRLRLFL